MSGRARHEISTAAPLPIISFNSIYSIYFVCSSQQRVSQFFGQTDKYLSRFVHATMIFRSFSVSPQPFVVLFLCKMSTFPLSIYVSFLSATNSSCQKVFPPKSSSFGVVRALSASCRLVLMLEIWKVHQLYLFFMAIRQIFIISSLLKLLNSRWFHRRHFFSFDGFRTAKIKSSSLKVVRGKKLFNSLRSNFSAHTTTENDFHRPSEYALRWELSFEALQAGKRCGRLFRVDTQRRWTVRKRSESCSVVHKTASCWGKGKLSWVNMATSRADSG